jgi:hypothetical protein
MDIAKLIATLGLDNTEFLEGLDDSVSKGKTVTQKLADVGQSVVMGIGRGLLAASVVGIGLFGAATNEAIAAEEVQSRLNSTLANTSQITGVTADMVGDLADQYSSMTRYEDDVVASGGEVLARFKEINSGVFPDALKLSMDLATRLGVDVPDAAELLGKALADPGTGLMKLKAAGVVFNDEQEKMIKKMAEAGDVAGAQAVIMDIVTAAVGGSAEAAGNNAAGMWDRLRNKFGNVLETLGMGVLPALMQLGTILMGYLNQPAVAVFVDKLAKGIADFAMQVVTWIPVVVQWLLNSFGWLMDNQGVIVGVLAGLGVAVLAFGVSVATAAWAAMVPMLPVIVIIAAVGAAAYLLYEAWTNNWGGIRDYLMGVWERLQPVFNVLKEWLSVAIPVALAILRAWWDKTLDNLKMVWGFLTEYIFPIFKALGDVLGAVLGVAFKAIAGIIQNVIVPAFQKMWQWIDTYIMPTIRKVADWLDEHLRPAFEAIGKEIKGVVAWLEVLAYRLGRMDLPDWMTPGSPTPWEMGLRGVNSVMQQLSRSSLPTFSAALQLQPQPIFATGAVDVRPRPVASSVSAETARGGMAANDPMQESIYRMLRDLPATIQRANRDVLAKASRK